MTLSEPRQRKALLNATLATTALLYASAANAVVDAPIIFSQAGQVDIIFTGNAGGFDHILEPVMVAGNGLFGAGVPTPPDTPPDYYAAWIIGTDGTGAGDGTPMTLVGDPGSPRAETTMNYNWGYFDVLAGQEITLRLTNVMTSRIGGSDPDSWGTIVSQLFSGSSAVNNTGYAGGSVAGGTPGAPDLFAPLPLGYTDVTFVDAYTIDVAFEDLDPNRLIDDRWKNMSVRFVLTPVPEPGTYALMLGGLAVVGWLGRRRGLQA